jgi:AhpD family alkylhydroperoxidase
MKTRIKMNEVAPEAYQAMSAIDKYLQTTPLTTTHKDLIKIRASQINGCAYCVDLHIKDALKAGETDRRLHNLVTWQETPFFTTEERIILAMTEEATKISNRVSDNTFEEAIRLLGKEYVAHVLMAIISINGWNRIGVTLNMMPS